MKKYIFLLAVLLGLSLQAQDLFSSFKPDNYANDLTEKIKTVLDIQDADQIQSIKNLTYSYAKSIQKYILLNTKRGLTEGKTLDEVVEMVKPNALKATKFYRRLGNIVGAENLEKLQRANIF